MSSLRQCVVVAWRAFSVRQWRRRSQSSRSISSLGVVSSSRRVESSCRRWRRGVGVERGVAWRRSASSLSVALVSSWRRWRGVVRRRRVASSWRGR
ncbi:hypothetical protein ACXZ9C_11660 [Streptococcus agalactiae]